VKSDPQVESFLPLTEVVFMILLSLAPGARHGYAIMKDVQSLSDGRVVLSTGTLYGALKRMLESGWIARSGEGESAAGRERKTYALTGLGAALLKAEVQRLDRLLAAARQRPLNGEL
jgi:DNA-binding PadR family transcriptional regulator